MKNPKHISSNVKKKTIQKLSYAICMLGEVGGGSYENCCIQGVQHQVR